jgi:LuxR family maltose regulon positive regulatory protein
VQRPRIDKLITQGARRQLTMVTGPAGAGKTMALALWADTWPGACAWITLDDYDNRPKVFWSYVITALRRAGITVPRALSAAVRGHFADHGFLLRFASAMAAQDPPVMLILDDLHLLTEPKVLDGLGYVLRNAGDGLHVLGASRMDPLLPLHQYRLGGQLTEIRASDLVFNSLEARSLIAQHGITLSADTLTRLITRAEGWAAGLRLAAISMAGHPDPDQFIKEFVAEDSAVTSYLVQEVLNAQPDDVRDFLLRTSILDRVNAGIASELADDEPPLDALPALARANAFVLPVGHGWYRYHSLLASVLRLKLRRERPDLVPDLHLRAARWYRRNGLLTEAVQHAGNAGDWPLAARTVLDELAVGRLIEPRDSYQLADGFRRMPDDLESAPPPLLLVNAAIELSRGQDDRAGAYLGAAEGMLERLPDAETPVRLAAAVLRLALSRRTGDLQAATAAVARAAALLTAVPSDVLARHPEVCAQVLAGRGAVEFWSGNLEAAAATLDAGMAAARTPDSTHERAECAGHLALVEALLGRLNQASQLAADATGLPCGNGDRLPEPVSAAAEVALACVYTERNERSLARARLKRADEMLGECPDRLISAVAALVAARRSLADGHAVAASEIAGRARQGWSPPPWLDHRLRLLESSACAAVSDTDAAVDMAVRAGPDSHLDAAVALAHAWLAAGDPQAARHALDSASAGGAVPDWVRVESCLADARLSYGSGETGRGRRSLAHALRLAEAERLRLPFALHRAWIRPVLMREPDLADTYRHMLEPGLASRADGAGQQPVGECAPPLIVEQLSEREREVLGHVSAMLSTAEIATEMYISVNTVKTHLKSIYRKLAATHRGEAVRRARKLQLL